MGSLLKVSSGTALVVLVVVVTGVLGSALAWSLARPHSRSELSREDLDRRLAENPGIGLVLPVDLPEGYRWFGPDDYFRSRGGVVQRTSLFWPDDPDSVPFVRICAEVTPASGLCPLGDPMIVRQVDSLRVVIVLSGDGVGPRSRAFWEKVPLTSSPDVAWLD